MTNKKELNNEELENVTGGNKPENTSVYTVGRELDQYETEQYIGSEVVVAASRSEINRIKAYGTLMRSYEDSWGCGTRRCCEIRLHPGCSSPQNTSSEGYAKCYVDHSPIFLIQYI